MATPAFASDDRALWESGVAPTCRLLADTLVDIAAEVADLAQTSDRLQGLISHALVADSAMNTDHLREFQDLDLLVQRLHGVAIFVGALAASTPAQWEINAAAAAANVPLTDLARRLRGAAPFTAPADQDGQASSGDFELFG